MCKDKAIVDIQTYSTGKFHRDSDKEILVPNVEVYKCKNEECGHTWLPIEQERKIDHAIQSFSRYDLQPHEINMIREGLPFSNKFQAANFLCVNEKAFTKWELGYSEPNRAYDLLLRLAVHSKENFSFIKHLHKTKFKFDPLDYQLICDKHKMKWNYSLLEKPEFEKQPVTFSIHNPGSNLETHSQSTSWYLPSLESSYSKSSSTEGEHFNEKKVSVA